MALDYEGVKAFAAPLFQPLFIPLLYLSLQSLGSIISLWESGDRSQDENEFRNLLYPKNYDFIIVGAGSAGCLLANRLSRQYSVLLLEAGGEMNPLQAVPGLSLFFMNQPHLDWMYHTVPQKSATLISLNHESSWSAGKGLGGSGTLNLMIYLRGHKRDFDQWAKVTGDPSWSWDYVLPYFRSFEDYHLPGDELNHGHQGELRIEVPDYTGTGWNFVKAGWEMGYPNVDLNAPFKEGFDIIRYPMRNGRAFGPYNAFLERIRSRKSLTIMKFAHVNKVLFRDATVAYGVEFDRHGKSHVAHASKEVILCSGTIGSSKLLMMSGIGPKEHLNELNIPVVVDLPVGQNLQDHLAVFLGPFYIMEDKGTYLDRDLTPSELVKWYTTGKGRLTSTGSEAAGVVSSNLAKARGEGDWPDLTLFSVSFTNFRLGAETLSRAFNWKYNELNRYIQDDIGKDSLYVTVLAARPLSRGFMKLGGNSPYDQPFIDPQYLSDRNGVDMDVLLEGVKKTMSLMENTTAMLKVGAKFTRKRLPGCEHHPFMSDLYWRCYIQRFSMSLHHFVGTASMGSVVDTKLKVIGLKGLRVVDASVIPVIPNMNTQAPTLMVAEKGADMILKFWNRHKLLNVKSFQEVIGKAPVISNSIEVEDHQPLTKKPNFKKAQIPVIELGSPEPLTKKPNFGKAKVPSTSTPNTIDFGSHEPLPKLKRIPYKLPIRLTSPKISSIFHTLNEIKLFPEMPKITSTSTTTTTTPLTQKEEDDPPTTQIPFETETEPLASSNSEHEAKQAENGEKQRKNFDPLKVIIGSGTEEKIIPLRRKRRRKVTTTESYPTDNSDDISTTTTTQTPIESETAKVGISNANREIDPTENIIQDVNLKENDNFENDKVLQNTSTRLEFIPNIGAGDAEKIPLTKKKRRRKQRKVNRNLYYLYK